MQPIVEKSVQPCCALARWVCLGEFSDRQMWVQHCPRHGQSVGSEIGLVYADADDDPPSQNTRDRRTRDSGIFKVIA